MFSIFTIRGLTPEAQRDPDKQLFEFQGPITNPAISCNSRVLFEIFQFSYGNPWHVYVTQQVVKSVNQSYCSLDLLCVNYQPGLLCYLYSYHHSYCSDHNFCKNLINSNQIQIKDKMRTYPISASNSASDSKGTIYILDFTKSKYHKQAIVMGKFLGPVAKSCEVL